MARHSREQSETGVYHVMLRGINRQLIFEDDEDRSKFLDLLCRFKKECGFELFGYCLMGNHVHLLIKENAVPLERIIKKIGTAYVYYFNQKYDRVGHLFQDRFRSEVVHDDPQLLQTLRYIHRNPVKAGMCSEPEEYSFSSYLQYKNEENGIADTDFILSMVSAEELIQFTNQPNDDVFIDISEKQQKRPTDREAKEIMISVCGNLSAAEFQTFGRRERDEFLVRLKEKGLSITQINRLTGVSRTIISRA